MGSVVSWILLILLVSATLQYTMEVMRDRLQPQLIGPNAFPQREGFVSGDQGRREGFVSGDQGRREGFVSGDQGRREGFVSGDQRRREGYEDGGGSGSSQAKEVFLDNEQLYDSFYAQIYDQLTQNMTRTRAKISMILAKWQNQGTPIQQMSFADIGCGTGVATLALAKMNVHKVIGIDRSPAMLHQAQTYLHEEKNLTEAQKKTISWKQADVQSPSALGGGEVSHAVILYFSLYYIPDKENFFRNMFLWVKPGGGMAVEVVNKYKFDPMLEASAPWMGFSLQKYSKERVTESKITFDKFEYTGKFELTDPMAEFRETFRFKDGKIRRQRHRFSMPSIEEIVKSAQIAGWKYTQFFDLTTIGFEYAYILLFRHP